MKCLAWTENDVFFLLKTTSAVTEHFFLLSHVIYYGKNDMHQDIQQKINNDNPAYFSIVRLNQNYSLINRK